MDNFTCTWEGILILAGRSTFFVKLFLISRARENAWKKREKMISTHRLLVIDTATHQCIWSCTMIIKPYFLSRVIATAPSGCGTRNVTDVRILLALSSHRLLASTVAVLDLSFFVLSGARPRSQPSSSLTEVSLSDGAAKGHLDTSTSNMLSRRIWLSAVPVWRLQLWMKRHIYISIRTFGFAPRSRPEKYG